MQSLELATKDAEKEFASKKEAYQSGFLDCYFMNAKDRAEFDHLLEIGPEGWKKETKQKRKK